MGDANPQYPGDRILCEGKFLRYVVACMRNCPYPDHCREFWAYFRAQGVQPREWLRLHGLPEDLMKRIVFDCDRCGKKDIGTPFSLFRTSGEAEGTRLSPEEFRPSFEALGPQGCSQAFLEALLAALKDQCGYEHYCEACFRKVGSLATALVNRPAPKAPARTSRQPAVVEALAASRTRRDPPAPAEDPRPAGRKRSV